MAAIGRFWLKRCNWISWFFFWNAAILFNGKSSKSFKTSLTSHKIAYRKKSTYKWFVRHSPAQTLILITKPPWINWFFWSSLTWIKSSDTFLLQTSDVWSFPTLIPETQTRNYSAQIIFIYVIVSAVGWVSLKVSTRKQVSWEEPIRRINQTAKSKLTVR